MWDVRVKGHFSVPSHKAWPPNLSWLAGHSFVFVINSLQEHSSPQVWDLAGLVLKVKFPAALENLDQNFPCSCQGLDP